MKMIAAVAFKYGARRLKADEEFECEAAHAMPLRLVGKAKDVTAPKKRRNGYRRRDMRVEG